MHARHDLLLSLCLQTIPSDCLHSTTEKTQVTYLIQGHKASVWESQKWCCSFWLWSWPLMASRKDHKENRKEGRKIESQAFTDFSFSALPARRNPLGSFKDYRLRLTPLRYWFPGSRSSPGLGICFFKVESHYIRETVIGNSIIKIIHQHWIWGCQR